MFKVEEFRYTEEEVQEIIDIVLAKFPTEEEYIKKRNPKIVKIKL